MRTYATAQLTGTRDAQCDATAVRAAQDGTRAYVLLDGVGSSETIRAWTRAAAVRLARAAVRRRDAEAGLRAVYDAYAAEPAREDPYTSQPKAAAVVAVTTPGKPLTVAWCGDSRAYFLTEGLAVRLTMDHNLRRVHPPTNMYPHGGNRNVITSYLGSTRSDKEVSDIYGHPAIETSTAGDISGDCRLLLASDGAYEPHEDARHDLYSELKGNPLSGIVREFVKSAVETSIKTTGAMDPSRVHADNATALIAHLN
jgi:serine/threonine protein phosphatase PrpC